MTYSGDIPPDNNRRKQTKGFVCVRASITTSYTGFAASKIPLTSDLLITYSIFYNADASGSVHNSQ